MRKAWKLVQKLIDKNAYHIKKKMRISDISDLERLKHLAGENVELAFCIGSGFDPTSNIRTLSEVADMMAILIHITIKNGYTHNDLERMIIKKLRERFGVRKGDKHATSHSKSR